MAMATSIAWLRALASGRLPILLLLHYTYAAHEFGFELLTRVATFAIDTHLASTASIHWPPESAT